MNRTTSQAKGVELFEQEERNNMLSKRSNKLKKRDKTIKKNKSRRLSKKSA
jgi:hypothetical protein